MTTLAKITCPKCGELIDLRSDLNLPAAAKTGSSFPSGSTVFVLLLLAWIGTLGFVARAHKQSLDAIEARLHAVESILFATNGTLVITQDSTGGYRFSWPNVPANKP